MAVEESLSKKLYKVELILLKALPVVIAVFYMLNTILSYFYIDNMFISNIAGVSFLPLLFLYVSSYVFRFCSYHRMFLHYIAIDDCLAMYDYYIGIPVSDKDTILIHLALIGISLLLILYLYVKHHKKPIKQDS